MFIKFWNIDEKPQVKFQIKYIKARCIYTHGLMESIFVKKLSLNHVQRHQYFQLYIPTN